MKRTGCAWGATTSRQTVTCHSTKLNNGTTHFGVCDAHSQAVCIGSRQGFHATTVLLLACEKRANIVALHISCVMAAMRSL